MELYIDAENLSRGRLPDFMKSGPPCDVPTQGTVGAIYVGTANGWVVVLG